MERQPISRNFMSQRMRMHYVDWGNEAAPPMILLHGGRDHCRSWDQIAQQFAKDWHVMALDLRGHGDSEWPTGGRGPTAAHVYDLAQLLHQRTSVPAVIMAHSMGARIALCYAGTYPEKVAKLIAIEGIDTYNPREKERGALPMSERMRDWIEEQRTLSPKPHRRYVSVEQAGARMAAENRHLTPAQARHLTEHGLVQNEDSSYSWKFDPAVRSPNPYDLAESDLHALWHSITCPVLLVHGAKSHFPDPRADGRDAIFKNVRVAMFDDASHYVQHDETDGLVAVVRDFLAGTR